jgi:hypothetical protein
MRSAGGAAVLSLSHVVCWAERFLFALIPDHAKLIRPLLASAKPGTADAK